MLSRSFLLGFTALLLLIGTAFYAAWLPHPLYARHVVPWLVRTLHGQPGALQLLHLPMSFEKSGFFRASLFGDRYATRLFLGAGFDPTAEFDIHGSPVLQAAQSADSEILQLYGRRGDFAKVSPLERYRIAAILVGIGAPELELVLDQFNMSVDWTLGTYPFDTTLLTLASTYCNLRATELLLARNASPDIADRLGNRPLDYAVTYCEPRLIELLVRAATPPVFSRERYTLLEYALLHHRMDLVPMLLAGRSLQQLDAREIYTLHFSQLHDPFSPLSLLVLSRPSLQAIWSAPTSLVHLLAQQQPGTDAGHRAAHRLFALGIPITLRDRRGATVLHDAARTGDRWWIGEAAWDPAQLGAADLDGLTPLDVALVHGSREVALELVRHGADPFRPSAGAGRPPVELARVYGSEPFAAALLRESLIGWLARSTSPVSAPDWCPIGNGSAWENRWYDPTLPEDCAVWHREPRVSPQPCLGNDRDPLREMADAKARHDWSIGSCDLNSGVMAHDDNSDYDAIPLIPRCCVLPSPDVAFRGIRIMRETRCPEGSVVIGAASRPERPGITCSPISSRYQLGPARKGRYWGKGSGWVPIAGRGDLRLDQIPPGMRTGIGRIDRDRWDEDGCIGDPPGSLLVERTGPRCDQSKYRELQFSGFPGDPPKGTPVPMFPPCKAEVNPYSSSAQCPE